jgi:hypothetical protein
MWTKARLASGSVLGWETVTGAVGVDADALLFAGVAASVVALCAWDAGGDSTATDPPLSEEHAAPRASAAATTTAGSHREPNFVIPPPPNVPPRTCHGSDRGTLLSRVRSISAGGSVDSTKS